MEQSPIQIAELYQKSDKGAGHEALSCPCGSEYVHPVAVRVARGKDVTVVTQKGTRQTDHATSGMKASPHYGRGVVIETEFVCEDGQHRFVIAHEFHKGWTFARLLLGDAGPSVGDDTIWRS